MATTKISELEFVEINRFGEEPRNNVTWHCHTPFGLLSVICRDLGLEMPCHDTESGFTDPDGNWWYRPGFDVRRFPDKTVEWAITEIKRGFPEEEQDES